MGCVVVSSWSKWSVSVESSEVECGCVELEQVVCDR